MVYYSHEGPRSTTVELPVGRRTPPGQDAPLTRAPQSEEGYGAWGPPDSKGVGTMVRGEEAHRRAEEPTEL